MTTGNKYYDELPQIDRDTIEAAIDTALGLGHLISVWDGGETTVKKSADRAAILGALCTSDEDRLYFREAGADKAYGWAWLVYGNEPGVIIADHTDNEMTAATLARSNKLMEEFEG